ncbi:hypothetical protein ACQP2P_34165 [Dactylosporangium sp. CA-139114]|uniref:hypothetical protein n=1 Tax=Dactylosporangium sp. CA-139114 TaxID=3239931 RepID=UPI003D96748A
MHVEPSETWLRSYLYVRIAMVGLLVALGAAVGLQTWHQGGTPLSSVSAYYYTPAQGIFIGSLVGLGASMIALRGTTDLEDVLLNLGGMLAPVVAVVPTARGDDYEAAVRACRAGGGPLPNGLDCPTVQALADATRANVQNNMAALLMLGGLGIAVTVALALRDGHAQWAGIGAAALLYAAALGTFLASLDWFIDHAHFAAAIGLLLCIIAVALVNRRRHRATGQAQARPDRYGLVAWALIAVAALGIPLWASGAISLFWLEIAVALLFAVFWSVQTVEQRPGSPTAVAPAAATARS